MAPVAPTIIAVDSGAEDADEAEQILHVVCGLVGTLLVSPGGDPDEELVGCTHLVRLGAPRVAVTVSASTAVDDVGRAALERRLLAITGARHVGAAVSVPDRPESRVYGPSDLADGAAQALTERADRAGGRLVRFPGRQHVVGRRPVRDIVRSSLIDSVDTLGAWPPTTATSVVDSRGFVRPVWRDGAAVLVVRPTARGTFEPVEPQDHVGVWAPS